MKKQIGNLMLSKRQVREVVFCGEFAAGDTDAGRIFIDPRRKKSRVDRGDFSFPMRRLRQKEVRSWLKKFPIE